MSISPAQPSSFSAPTRAPDDPGAVSGGQGTSFATAHLAGVAALWLAYHGRDKLIPMLPRGTTLQQVFRTLVRMTATPAEVDTSEHGAGVTNAAALLEVDPSSAFGREATFSAPETDMRRQVAVLVAAAQEAGGLEAVAPALGDTQNLPEIACVALDRIRASHTRQGRTEALPPPSVSPG
jgi:subtilisin family serine protease